MTIRNLTTRFRQKGSEDHRSIEFFKCWMMANGILHNIEKLACFQRDGC